MVDVDKSVISRYKAVGETFEILVDCNNALKLKAGEEIPLSDVVASEDVFSDVRKGLKASDAHLNSAFETTEFEEIAKQIIAKGDIQITAEHRKKILDEKRTKILNYINRNGVDPKTGNPHPLTRIELAFDEAKIRIDEYKSIKQQTEEIITKLRVILPISFEKKKFAIVIPGEFAGKAYPIVKSFGKMQTEDWRNDGSWACIIEIPAGVQNDMMDKLNNMTSGNVQIEAVKE